MIPKPDIDRLGIDSFVDNIFVNIIEDLNGGQTEKSITDYYMSNYDVDITFSEENVNLRLYTESNGWHQSSLKLNKNVITNTNLNR